MLMNRIGPSSSDLYIANADGTGERRFLEKPVFEYNASFSADGTSVVFSAAAAGAQGRAFDSTPSRTDVKAELAQARANGELNGMREWAIDGTSAITTRSAPAGARGRAFTAEPGLTRAQVRAELDRARASGEMERFMSQHGGGN